MNVVKETRRSPRPHEKVKGIRQHKPVPRTGTGALAEKAKALRGKLG